MAEGTVTEDRVMGRFQKSNSASIQVSLIAWEGNEYLDLREVVPSNKPGEQFAYTRKGVRFRADLLGELLEILEKAAK